MEMLMCVYNTIDNDIRCFWLYLQKHGARIIIGNFYENRAQQIFCEAYKQKMYGAKYVWIITGG